MLRILTKLSPRFLKDDILIKEILPENDKKNIIEMVHQCMRAIDYTGNGRLICHTIAWICNLTIIKCLRGSLKSNYIDGNDIMLKMLHILTSLLLYGIVESMKGVETKLIFDIFLECLHVFCEEFDLIGYRGIRSDISIWEPSLMELDFLNVSKTVVEVCCSCYTEQPRYQSGPSVHAMILNSPTSSNIAHPIEYCANEKCNNELCGAETIIKLTTYDSNGHLFLYLDQLIAKTFDVNEVKEIEIISPNGFKQLYGLEMVTVLKDRHYWVNTLNNGSIFEWESLNRKIQPLRRCIFLDSKDICMFQYKRFSNTDIISTDFSPLIGGLARNLHINIPIDLLQIFEMYYPNGEQIQPNENDPYSVIFGNGSTEQKRKCLDKIRSEMIGN
eukprot:158572_1